MKWHTLLLATGLIAWHIMSASFAAGVDVSPLSVETERAFPELKFERPVAVAHAGDGSNRLFVLGQLGVISVFPNDNEVEEAATFLNIKDRVVYNDNENEEGLLGVAFHPKYKENGEFFVYYTSKKASPHTSVISRFKVSADDPNKADPKSEEELLRIPQPFWNHNGGTLAFGPDGFLYVGLGDGGSGGDPLGNGQKLDTLLGKILRIDVDHKDPGKQYAIPKDNPFAGQPKKGREEIWAYGVRNIWRLSFDRETGTCWGADVGQDLWEEVNIIVRGGNYGWNLREAMHPFGPNGSEPKPELIDPIWEYPHTIGKSITGGHVYRGSKIPELVGCYLYGDYVSGNLWGLRYDEQSKKVTANRPIAGKNLPVVSFGEDEQGEVYFTTTFGTLYRFVPKAQ